MCKLTGYVKHWKVEYFLHFNQKKPPEVFYKNSCSDKFLKIHRKITVPESLFGKTFKKVIDARNISKKRIKYRYFLVTFTKFLRTPF